MIFTQTNRNAGDVKNTTVIPITGEQVPNGFMQFSHDMEHSRDGETWEFLPAGAPTTAKYIRGSVKPMPESPSC